MQKWGCGWDAGATGREMANLVSWSLAQESVTVQTLECRSCLNAELEHTKGVKGAGRRLGREGPGKGGHREGAGEKHKGFHVATGWEGRHAFRPSENKNEKPKPKQKPQMPCQTKRAIT